MLKIGPSSATYSGTMYVSMSATMKTSKARRSSANNVVRYVQNAVGRAQTVHHGHMPEIEIIDETDARGI
ncbi:MAG: hypothetical protein R3A47_05345 [Polyangiales bacterium]